MALLKLVTIINDVSCCSKFYEKIDKSVLKSWLVMKFTKLNYCQYLLSSQINYTMTNQAEHLSNISHDKTNYYLKNEKLTPRLLWDNVQDLIVPDEDAYIIFDDTVLDKRFSEEIEIVRRQYSGNEHGVIRGIGIVNCIYVNPKTLNFWVIDYRIFNPDNDGLSKIDHVKNMLQGLVYHRTYATGTIACASCVSPGNSMLQKRYPFLNVVGVYVPLDITPLQCINLLTFMLNIISTYYY
ncbi:transposase [Nostoc sp. 'Lobaria pulmonaria (5183) cyanobiont']|nr:hypothetical protein [Nostoc sp. 'Lobaria pulmonaria (5183) cyanobiont']AVH70560.1 transposase [Nostoc sp. 'Lobaria pulmonaria (5183) cyanobiont']